MTRASRRKKAYRNKKNSARKARATASTLLLSVTALIAVQPARAQTTGPVVHFVGDNWISSEDYQSWFTLNELYSDPSYFNDVSGDGTDIYFLVSPVDMREGGDLGPVEEVGYPKLHLADHDGTTSSVSILNGGMLYAGEFHIAHGAGSTGSMLISGGRSTVISTMYPMMVGHYGSGVLRIDSGGTLVNSSALIAGGGGF